MDIATNLDAWFQPGSHWLGLGTIERKGTWTGFQYPAVPPKRQVARLLFKIQAAATPWKQGNTTAPSQGRS